MTSLPRASVWLTLCSLVLGPSGALRAAEAPTVPDPALLLDSGTGDERVRLSELGSGPYVVAPIFTSCRAVCSVVAKALGSARAGEGPAAAEVVLVSFDPQDDRHDMARFRSTFDLPEAWHLATLEREEGLRFFSSLGFRWRTLAERQFDHAGKVFVLTAALRVAAVLGPDQLTHERLAAEVAAASSQPTWIRRAGSHVIGLLGVGSLLLLLIVAVTSEKVLDGLRRRAAAPDQLSND